MNTLTVSQKGLNCGEIRIHHKINDIAITPALRELAEHGLRAHPDSQRSYYDLLLVDDRGKELDFETNIL